MTSNELETDITIVSAGPVGLMCAHLARLCGLRAIVLDKSAEPLQVGRADALRAGAERLALDPPPQVARASTSEAIDRG